MGYLWIFLALLFFSQPQSLQGDDFSVKMISSASQLELEDTLKITLLLQHPDDYSVNPDALLEVVLDNGALAPAPFSGELVYWESFPGGSVVSYALYPKVAGMFWISFQNISFTGLGGVVNIPSGLFRIEVAKGAPPILSDMGQPLGLLPLSNRRPFQADMPAVDQEQENRRNVAALAYKHLPWKEYLFVLVVSVVLLLLLRKKGAPQLPKLRQYQARNHLKQLLQQPEATADDLIKSLKDYFDEVYGLDTFAMTTPELSQAAIKRLYLNDTESTRLRSILELSDRAKFQKGSEAIDVHSAFEQFLSSRKI